MKRLIYIVLCSFILFYLFACKGKDQGEHNQHKGGNVKKPAQYTCAMHPQILKDQPGQCPICGMELIKKVSQADAITEVQLESLLKPTNQYVISTLPVTTIKKDQVIIEIDALGKIEYDTRMIGTISANINGRIEKLYVRYMYQYIKKGQKVMDIYSPELLTAQENLLFILKSDASNVSLLQAARQKLELLGMSANEVQKVMQTGKPYFAVSVYSNYNGHLHNAAGASTNMNQPLSTTPMEAINLSTESINLKEGMYVQKGQTLFSIYDPSRAWALLNIYSDGKGQVRKGQLVKITPETAPDKFFEGRIDFIEPFFREGSQTISARVYFNNSSFRLPVGSQVRASIKVNPGIANWLPKESVTSLGIDRIVFLKAANGFRPKKVITGITDSNKIQIIGGLSKSDSVASQAQYLIDSESFIKVKEQ